MRRVVVKLTPDSVDNAIKELRNFQKWLAEKTELFVEELGREGVAVAQLKFSTAPYDGERDVTVTSEKRGRYKVAVSAIGKSVLFIEFGTGITFAGTTHPEGAATGMVPGSWSDGPEGKGHWKDPKGWYYKHGMRSLGNPPGMAMYETVRELERKMEEIARRVFV